MLYPNELVNFIRRILNPENITMRNHSTGGMTEKTFAVNLNKAGIFLIY